MGADTALFMAVAPRTAGIFALVERGRPLALASDVGAGPAASIDAAGPFLTAEIQEARRTQRTAPSTRPIRSAPATNRLTPGIPTAVACALDNVTAVGLTL
jgi:hypothetical protein